MFYAKTSTIAENVISRYKWTDIAGLVSLLKPADYLREPLYG